VTYGRGVRYKPCRNLLAAAVFRVVFPLYVIGPWRSLVQTAARRPRLDRLLSDVVWSERTYFLRCLAKSCQRAGRQLCVRRDRQSTSGITDKFLPLAIIGLSAPDGDAHLRRPKYCGESRLVLTVMGCPRPCSSPDGYWHVLSCRVCGLFDTQNRLIPCLLGSRLLELQQLQKLYDSAVGESSKTKKSWTNTTATQSVATIRYGVGGCIWYTNWMQTTLKGFSIIS